MKKNLLDMRWCILKSLIRARGTLHECLIENKKTGGYSQLWQTRRFSNDSEKKCDDEKENMRESEDHNLAVAISTKYKIFNDKDADIILDVTEEQQKIDLEELNIQEIPHDPYVGINLDRGTNGVFDIEDVVTLLERDKAKNIFVASVPKEYAYVDYIIVVAGRSTKHMNALATFIRKVYKLKRYPTDLLPKIEGKDSSDWIALDLGNIALHIFSASARERYDLETLWTVGSQYDDKTNTFEELDIMDQYNTFLANLQPADG